MREHKVALPREVQTESLIGYARLFQLENWFRELVYLETKAHFGNQWWAEAEQALSRSASPGIPADKSLRGDKKHPHMATPENDPLWFLSFDSLLKVVFDDQLWSLFEPYLTTKELLQAKFTEILPIRNRIGHNRKLHEDDLDRLRRLLRDLDQGFWRFCTSFNDVNPFIGDRRSDRLYQAFQDRMGFDYAEIEPNRWALVGSTRGMSQNVMVEYSFRPSANANGFPEKGRLYHFNFWLTGNQRAMDYQPILEYTQKYHPMVIYIILDSSQRTLRVTIPALYEPENIIAAAERFYYAVGNMFTVPYWPSIDKQAQEAGASVLEEYDAVNKPFELIASRWPHYILPPGHAFEVLGPDCPCSFFEAD